MIAHFVELLPRCHCFENHFKMCKIGATCRRIGLILISSEKAVSVGKRVNPEKVQH